MIDLDKTPLVPSAKEPSAKGMTLLQLAEAIGSPPALFQVMVGRWQEAIPEDRLERYRPLTKAIAGAKSSQALDTRRGWRCVDWTVRTFITEHARLIGWPQEADKLRALPPIEGPEGLEAALLPMRRIVARALLISGAAHSIRQARILPLGHVFERTERWKARAILKDFGHASGELEDVREYAGFAALGCAGLPAIKVLISWPELIGVRGPAIHPTLGCAQEVQHAAAVGINREQTDALTNWLCDSFFGLATELAKMKESPARRSRKASYPSGGPPPRCTTTSPLGRISQAKRAP